MNKLNIVFFLIIAFFMVSCTSDGTSDVKQLRSIDLSDLTMYVGPAPTSKHEYWKDKNGNEIKNIDSLRNRLMNEYFGVTFSSEKIYNQRLSFEFANGKVTYVNENDTSIIPSLILDSNFREVGKKKISMVISSYDFLNDSMYVQLSDGNQFHAVSRVVKGDTLLITRGFTYYPTRSGVGVTKDSKAVDENIALGYSKYTNMNEMIKEDMIVYCNVRYLIY